MAVVVVVVVVVAGDTIRSVTILGAVPYVSYHNELINMIRVGTTREPSYLLPLFHLALGVVNTKWPFIPAICLSDKKIKHEKKSQLG